MKIVILLISALSLGAQIISTDGTQGKASAGSNIPIQLVATDTLVNTPASYNYSIAIPRWFFAQLAFPGVPTLTLTGNVASNATVIPVSSSAGLAVGMGLCMMSLPVNTLPVPTTCPLTNNVNGCTTTGCLAISGGEVSRIMSISGNNVTVLRTGTIGTPGTYTTGQFVIPLLYGSYTDYGAAWLSASPPPLPAQIVQNWIWGAPDALYFHNLGTGAASGNATLK
jgi:hypothetical protein